MFRFQTSLRLLVSLLLLTLVSCTARGGGGGGGDDDDATDEPAREPANTPGVADDSADTSDSGSGDLTEGSEEGESHDTGLGGESTLYVVNASSLDVGEIYVTPCDANSWGDDQLVDWILPDNWFFVLTGIADGCYDIEAWDVDGDYYWDLFAATIEGEFTFILGEPVWGDDDDAVDDDDDIVDDDDDSVECNEDEVEDCDGGCSPADWLADDYCDESLNCAEWDYDFGDCSGGDDDDTPPDDDDDATGGCGPDEVEDCNGLCGPIEWIGDEYCDDETYEYNGNLIDFNCEEFDFDAGDCKPQ